MLRAPFSSILIVALGLLLVVVMLVSFGFTRQLQRENAVLGAEAMRLRSANDALQNRLQFVEQSTSVGKDRLAHEQRSLETLRGEVAALSSALGRSLAESERLKAEKDAALLEAAKEKQDAIRLEQETTDLKRQLLEAKKEVAEAIAASAQRASPPALPASLDTAGKDGGQPTPAPPAATPTERGDAKAAPRESRSGPPDASAKTRRQKAQQPDVAPVAEPRDPFQ